MQSVTKPDGLASIAWFPANYNKKPSTNMLVGIKFTETAVFKI
jgi:hypothetical protein